MSNDNKLTGEAWGVFDKDSLRVTFIRKYDAEVECARYRGRVVRRIRWETIDDTKGDEQ